jgi:bacterial/archaeal transporter family protein
MAAWRLKKGADGLKRLAGTLAPPPPSPKSATIKIEKHAFYRAFPFHKTGIRKQLSKSAKQGFNSLIMTTDSNWFFWAIFSAIFAALTAIFAKVGLDGVDSDLATLIRTVIILAVLSGFVYFTGKWSNPFALSPKTLLFLMLSGLATGASWVCYFRALKIGEASKVAPVDKLSLLLVAVFAFLFLHERPSVREWTGILMVGAGVLVLAFKK